MDVERMERQLPSEKGTKGKEKKEKEVTALAEEEKGGAKVTAEMGRDGEL